MNLTEYDGSRQAQNEAFGHNLGFVQCENIGGYRSFLHRKVAMQEETKESLQQRADALNREYIHAMDGPEGPEKQTRLQRLRDAIMEYEKRIKPIQGNPGRRDNAWPRGVTDLRPRPGE
jgi:hypothetical protein